MHFPGSAQLGHGARMLRAHAWYEWESHPEWVNTSPEHDPNDHVALGVPGKIRVIYTGYSCWIPRRPGRLSRTSPPRPNTSTPFAATNMISVQ